MKVIDLYNKIANGEELPKRIKINDDEYLLHNRFSDYFIYKRVADGEYLDDVYIISNILNYEVEIIEEDNKIRKVGLQEDGTFRVPSRLELASKVNEIIDYLEEKE